MGNSMKTNLVGALYHVIENIGSNYSKNWLITGYQELDKRNYPDSAIFAQCEKVINPDTHTYTEFCFCVHGNFVLHLGDKAVPMMQGDVAVIEPGVLHNELPVKNCEYQAIWVVMDLNRTVVHLSGKNKQDTYFTVDGHSLIPDYECVRLLKSITGELKGKQVCLYELIKNDINRLSIVILRSILSEQKQKDASSQWKLEVVKQVQNYIECNYAMHLQLRDISQRVCISINYLNTMFKAVMGKTIMQYLEEYRLDRAKHLLQNTSESINQISIQLGYYDQYHFSKIFKKSIGCSPSQFRHKD